MKKPNISVLILKAIEQDNGITQTQLCRHFNKSKKAICNRIKYLKDRGLIAEIQPIFRIGNSKSYGLTREGKSIVHVMLIGGERSPTITWTSTSKNVRSHNFRIGVDITRFPKSVDWLKDKNVWRCVPFTNWNRYIRRLDKVTLLVTPKSIIFYLHEIWAYDSFEALGIGFEVVNQVIGQLCKEYDGLVLGSPYQIGKILTQEHALVNDVFARICSKRGSSINNKVISVDSSFEDELDFISSQFSHEDCLKYADFIRAYVRGGIPFEKLEKLDKLDEVHVMLGRFLYYLFEKKDFVGGFESIKNN